ncbi:MAG: response regulator [Anaerolineales bacterium]|nr:response regulator [Anaerolineales bacterium]
MDLTTIFNRPPRILIADDDWLNRDLLKTYLVSSGCEVITAPDGQTALDLALNQPPDLALLDIQMPRLDGIQLCQTLKSTPDTRFIPVVIVTAFDTDEERIKAIDAGADDFISKPYSSIILLTRVRSLLRIKKLNDEIEARNRLLRQVLDRYVAEDVADIILTDPEQQLQLGGETRVVTVLFADIRGFTKFTEQHSAPEVIDTLNRIFTPLSNVVFAYRGTFDKYTGDGLMAFYGAPISEEDDANRAMDTAVAMQRLFHTLREESGEVMKDLDLGIGLHTGEAVVGNIGSEIVMDYTVVGDTVNVAKRLQEAAGEGQILLSEATYQRTGNVEAEKLRPIYLPGRSEPITAYVIKGPFI